MDPFRNFNQFKIDPLTEIRNAGIVTGGSVMFVSSTADSDHRERTDQLGGNVVKVSLQSAIDEAQTDNNDYILVYPTDGGTVVPLGTAVDINEDRLHILGMGYKPAPMGYNGLTFEGYVHADGVDTELVAVTGAGVELGGLKFLGTSGTHANGSMTAMMTVGTAASGTPHDFWMHDVHIENTQAAAAGGTQDIVNISGDVAGGIQGMTFERCWLGNWNWAPQDVVSMAGTAGPTRATFRDVTFVIDAQATTDQFITLGTGVTEMTMFENCKFINVEAGTAPASAVEGALLVDNPVLAINTVGLHVTQVGTDTEFFVAPVSSGTRALLYNTNLALGTAALVAA
jgi:hypothetical protein